MNMVDPVISGIYVYSFPHYLRFPADTASLRTYFKVGRSDSGVISRYLDQTATTAIPEPPVLLRIYPTDSAVVNTAAVEAGFHRKLKAMGHYRERAAIAGREWFLTELWTLDKIARSMSLPVMVVNTPAVVCTKLDLLDKWEHAKPKSIPKPVNPASLFPLAPPPKPKPTKEVDAITTCERCRVTFTDIIQEGDKPRRWCSVACREAALKGTCCHRCGEPVSHPKRGPIGTFCSPACRTAAWRARRTG